MTNDEQPLNENVIRSSPLDRTDYGNCRDEAVRMIETEVRIQNVQKYRRQAKRLSEDVFTSLIRVDAPWRTPDEVNTDFHINGIALKLISSLEEFDDLHESARSSRVFSEFATEQLIPYIPKIYKDLENAIGNAIGDAMGQGESQQQEQQDSQGSGNQDQSENQQGQGQGEGRSQSQTDSQGSGGGDKQDGTTDGSAGSEGQGGQQGNGAPNNPGGEGWSNEEGPKAPPAQWDERLQGASKEWEDDLRRELTKVNRVIGEAEELFRQAGATRATGFNEHDMVQMLRVLADSELIKTLALVGDMAKVATGLRKRVMRHVPGGRNGIEFGNNIRLATTGERLLLQDERTKYLFYAKQAERRLLQHQESGVTRAGGGPVVMCVDCSGSMHGQRIIWARALAETTRRTAYFEHRDFVLITFASSVESIIRFPGKTALKLEDLDKLLKMAAGGGTNFYRPLTAALKQVNKFGHGDRADIMFVTDGNCALGNAEVDEIKQSKTDLGVKIHSVFIDNGNTGEVPGVLKRFSDSVLRSTKMNAADGAVVQAVTLALGDDARNVPTKN